MTSSTIFCRFGDSTSWFVIFYTSCAYGMDRLVTDADIRLTALLTFSCLASPTCLELRVAISGAITSHLFVVTPLCS